MSRKLTEAEEILDKHKKIRAPYLNEFAFANANHLFTMGCAILEVLVEIRNELRKNNHANK